MPQLISAEHVALFLYHSLDKTKVTQYISGIISLWQFQGLIGVFFFSYHLANES